ncbi:Autophagy protein 7 [Apophysomyces ossiformis]|uniref:Ubiquitin-like modifier-activating enzyme ATG7 n=1 Tax=Apophysomyces ossiformis TaxID=679940 RepID=A0A8H7BY42_9FUNG|nr:Autophagy protein 7 [Apophysomyces ossiformis]
MTESNVEILQFEPFVSAVDAAFWHAFTTKKLDYLKLNDASQPLRGYYTPGQLAADNQGQVVAMPPRLCLPAQALEINDETRPLNACSVSGALINTNTIEEFRKMDKNKLFSEVWDAIRSKRALDQPELLSQFMLLAFADLKRYKFYYWFAFPAVMPQPSPWKITQPGQPLGETYSPEEIDHLDRAYQVYRSGVSDGHAMYFLIRSDQGSFRIGRLNEWDDFFADGPLSNQCMIGFVDPAAESLPGWPLRNLLALVYECWGLRKLNVLCYRGKTHSRLLYLEFPDVSCYTSHEGPVKAVGWERNAQGKLGPRMADLGPLMDPLRLADSAVDLNLKLMRWRLVPDLDLDKVKNNKCLLLGAGTLGCYVARSLLGWGVRHITFVDNGQVSFSNPTRQPLYDFQDCLEGGAPKAQAAAKQLKRILPSLNATGHHLSIPMPGHPASSDDQLRRDMNALSELVETHDTLFLLTDSRESRWFPTLLGAKANKMVINAALGFDTYLVMRHGAQLGCYFCSDIVAPTDSLTDRTLDQQCTVTRPGLAAIAGALATELMVTLLQHKDGVNAPADRGMDVTMSTDTSSVLGIVPHQIRGFLSHFNNMLIVGQAYDRCTACSAKVIEAYTAEPLDLMKKVLADSVYLEHLTGITDMKKESEDLLNDDWVAGDDDDF